MNFNHVIIDFCTNIGATIVGFADISILSSAQNKGFNFGVSIGIALNPKIVAEIPTGPHIEYYNHYCEVSDKLNILTHKLYSYIINRGYNAYPLSRENVKQNSDFRTILPHKTIARLSGLGWIGKSALLINEKYGGAVRYYSVLSDMPFKTGKPIDESLCGDCQICHTHCPARAVNKHNWVLDIDRDQLLDASKCKQTVIERGKSIGGKKDGSCGICIAVCPYTQAYIKNN